MLIVVHLATDPWGVVCVRTGISAKLNAFGTLPCPVGARFAPDDRSVRVPAQSIVSWLIAQVTAAHTEIIARVDGKVRVTRKAQISIRAIREIAVRSRSSNDRNHDQTRNKSGKSKGTRKHCD